jgi:APA family basic amino acid/polyamine antiporter
MEALFVALSPVLFSFGGWQQGTWVAGEVRDARRNVPVAIIFGVLIVIATYILANLAFFSLLGFSGVEASRTPAADAVETVAGGWGRRVIAGAIAVSAFGVMNAQLLSGPRYIYAMARDGRFFRVFDHLHDRFQTPARAIALLGALSLLLLVLAGQDGLNRLLNGVVFVDWVFFAMTGAAVILLRHKLPHAPRSVRVPGYPVTPVLFVLFALSAVAGSFLDEEVRSAAVLGLIWIALGALFSQAFLRSARSRPR